MIDEPTRDSIPVEVFETRAGQERLKEAGIRPIPLPDDVTRPYWEYARQHELRVQRCSQCGTYRHPPTAPCPECSSPDVDWVLLSGRGTIYSYIVDYRLMVPGFNAPYAVVIVRPDDLPPGCVHIVANLNEIEVEAIEIGLEVQVEFETVSPVCTLPQFRPVVGFLPPRLKG